MTELLLAPAECRAMTIPERCVAFGRTVIGLTDSEITAGLTGPVRNKLCVVPECEAFGCTDAKPDSPTPLDDPDEAK